MFISVNPLKIDDAIELVIEIVCPKNDSNTHDDVESFSNIIKPKKKQLKLNSLIINSYLELFYK